ncbi:conjugal transfer entry exclusion protein TraS [Klebsiella pneumoniae]|nr:conjugal transfer entry exclusion protein TraS [Klebsiella pneumoniae]
MFHVLVFPVGVSTIMLLGIASSRSLFLSVPKNFREKSNVYRFFAKKVFYLCCCLHDGDYVIGYL